MLQEDFTGFSCDEIEEASNRVSISEANLQAVENELSSFERNELQLRQSKNAAVSKAHKVKTSLVSQGIVKDSEINLKVKLPFKKSSKSSKILSPKISKTANQNETPETIKSDQTDTVQAQPATEQASPSKRKKCQRLSFVLPKVSVRSARTIKPNKRWLEDSYTDGYGSLLKTVLSQQSSRRQSLPLKTEFVTTKKNKRRVSAPPKIGRAHV